jgi:hypothetical protein
MEGGKNDFSTGLRNCKFLLDSLIGNNYLLMRSKQSRNENADYIASWPL